MIFYESPYRLLKTLTDLKNHFGADRQVCVSRELTKLHEENTRGTIDELLAYYSAKPIKGEIVIVVDGKK